MSASQLLLLKTQAMIEKNKAPCLSYACFSAPSPKQQQQQNWPRVRPGLAVPKLANKISDDPEVNIRRMRCIASATKQVQPRSACLVKSFGNSC